MKKVVADRRVVYDDVRREFGEELLRLETASPAEVKELGNFAKRVLSGTDGPRGIPPEVGALMLLRFGDSRSWSALRRILTRTARGQTARAAGFAMASYGDAGVAIVRSIAERELEGPLRVVARFMTTLDELRMLPERIRARLQLRFDAVQHRKYLDMRTLLIARLFGRSAACRTAVLNILRRWQPDLSPFERRLVAARIR